MLVVRRLLRDEWNVAPIARHEVFPEEVEEVCHGRPLTSATYNDRLRVIGPTALGRMLTVILAPEGEAVYYVVTARPARRKERQRYSDETGGETT
jgi:uncharacterized DUF497 family protein